MAASEALDSVASHTHVKKQGSGLRIFSACARSKGVLEERGAHQKLRQTNCLSASAVPGTPASEDPRPGVGLRATRPRETVLLLMANHPPPSWESPLQSASPTMIRLCIHYCPNVQILIKTLMKENQQSFITTEEQSLTAFISGGRQGSPRKPSVITLWVCLSSSGSEVGFDSEVLTAIYIGELGGNLAP